MPILCSGSPKTWEKLPFLTQKWQFCAREEGENGIGKPKGCIGKRKGEAVTLNVTFLQITAQAFKMQIPHNQIINF